MTRTGNRWLRVTLLVSALLAATGTSLAQDDAVSGDEPLGGDEDPGANATDDEVAESAEDYYAQPRESTPGPSALALLAGVAGAAALVSFTRRPRA